MKLVITPNLDGTLRFFLLDYDNSLIATSIDYRNYDECREAAQNLCAAAIFADIEYLPPTGETLTMRFEVEP